MSEYAVGNTFNRISIQISEREILIFLAEFGYSSIAKPASVGSRRYRTSVIRFVAVEYYVKIASFGALFYHVLLHFSPMILSIGENNFILLILIFALKEYRTLVR